VDVNAAAHRQRRTDPRAWSQNGHAPYDVPAGLIRSAKTLFHHRHPHSFCTMMESLQEAEAKS